MAIKKYTNGSWVPASFHKYGTETDTITTLPATVIGDGTPISSYVIKGNMEQSGTPTPENPIVPIGCGERTENFCDENNINQGYYAYADGQYSNLYTWVNTGYIAIKGNTEYTAKFKTIYDASRWYGFVWYDNDKQYISTTNTQANPFGCELTATSPANAAFCVFNICSQNVTDGLNPSGVIYFMLTEGSTALPYEPYGYKLPVTLGNTTTNIYLGEVQSERRIKKLVLTGEETIDTSGMYYTTTVSIPTNDRTNFVCSHFQTAAYDGSISINSMRFSQSLTSKYDTAIFNYDSGSGGAENFKTYLAAQYAAGTPVTVWYVLETPETVVVNEPICKIGDYVDSVSGTNLATSGTAQEFDVGTTLKPSELDLTYHGWHEHDDTKYST